MPQRKSGYNHQAPVTNQKLDEAVDMIVGLFDDHNKRLDTLSEQTSRIPQIASDISDIKRLESRVTRPENHVFS